MSDQSKSRPKRVRPSNKAPPALYQHPEQQQAPSTGRTEDFYAKRLEQLINELPIMHGADPDALLQAYHPPQAIPYVKSMIKNPILAEEILNIATSTGNGLSAALRLYATLHVRLAFGETTPQAERAERVEYEILAVESSLRKFPCHAMRLDYLHDKFGYRAAPEGPRPVQGPVQG